MRSQRRIALVLTAVACVLAASCSAGDEVSIPAAAPGARVGGTLRVAISEPASIDPGNAQDAAGRLVVSAMCDPLIDFDPVTGALKPAVAESWQLSDRGKKMTLRIRRGAKFSDGKDLTANDVLFSLSRLASADFASFESDLMKPVLGFGTVHGDVDTENEEVRRSLKGVKVIEGNSLEIELETEFAPFLRALGHPAASPVSREAAERDPLAFERKPVCAGPYRMTQPWKPGDPRIELERVPGYGAHNAAYSAGGRGYADKIELSIVPDAQAQLAALNAGQVDVAEVPDARLAESRARHGARVVQAVVPAIEFVGVSTTDETFRRAEVRRALSLALDRRAIAATVFGGVRAPATGFLPPTLGSDLYRDHACGPAIADGPDIAGATALLRQAGVALADRRISFSFNDEQTNKLLVEAVAKQWNAAFGMVVDLKPMPWQEYLSTGLAGEGFAGAFRMSWESTHPDPDRYLAPLFGAEGIGVGNFGRFTNPEFDRILQFSARRGLEEDERTIEYRRLEDLACDLMPMIPVTFDVDHFVRSERVSAPEDRMISRPTGAPALRELYLNE